MLVSMKDKLNLKMTKYSIKMNSIVQRVKIVNNSKNNIYILMIKKSLIKHMQQTRNKNLTFH
jgi:hypothetical protein